MASVNVKNILITKRSKNVDLYFKDIADYEILTNDEEIALFHRIKKGDEKAKEKIIQSNQRFVVAVAKRLTPKDDLLLDLINEGNIGLILAINKYEPRMNNRFLTYAVHWIHRQIYMYLTFKNESVKKSNVGKTTTYVAKVQNEFLMKYGRLPELEELKDILNKRYKLNIIHDIDLLRLQVSSIDIPDTEDMPSSDNEFNSLYNDINIAEDNANKEHLKFTCEQYLSKLDSRAQKIVKMLYGIGYPQEYNPIQIGEEIGLTKERVRQIHNESLLKLRKIIKYK